MTWISVYISTYHRVLQRSSVVDKSLVESLYGGTVTLLRILPPRETSTRPMNRVPVFPRVWDVDGTGEFLSLLLQSGYVACTEICPVSIKPTNIQSLLTLRKGLKIRDDIDTFYPSEIDIRDFVSLLDWGPDNDTVEPTGNLQL